MNGELPYGINIEISELDCRQSKVSLAQVIAQIRVLARTPKMTCKKTILGAIVNIEFNHDEVRDIAFDRIEDYFYSLPESDRMVISPTERDC